MSSKPSIILDGMAVAIPIATYASYRIAAAGMPSGIAAYSQELQLLPMPVSVSAQGSPCARLSCVIATRAELGLAS